MIGLSQEELRAAMKTRFKAMNINEWCGLTGCSKSHVYEFVRGLRGPPHDMLAALNLEVRYVKKRRARANNQTAERGS